MGSPSGLHEDILSKFHDRPRPVNIRHASEINRPIPIPNDPKITDCFCLHVNSDAKLRETESVRLESQPGGHKNTQRDSSRTTSFREVGSSKQSCKSLSATGRMFFQRCLWFARLDPSPSDFFTHALAASKGMLILGLLFEMHLTCCGPYPLAALSQR